MRSYVFIFGFLIHLTLNAQKINGVCTVAPDFVVKNRHFNSIEHLNANWIAVIPYAFCGVDRPEVTFDHDRQWWGETSPGIAETIRLAKQRGLSVMLKPHLWVIGQGWAGDLAFSSGEDLQQWQSSYSRYLVHFTKLADSLDVDLISIGTELKQLVSKDPDFWTELICSVRNVYDHPLTYSANWDNYQNVTFWSELDYVGIDAYFPITEKANPSYLELREGIKSIKDELASYSLIQQRPIIFTEYGFRSIDSCAYGHWISDYERTQVNTNCQAIAYQAWIDAFWPESWFEGGFLWKWFFNHDNAGGVENDKFTPQNKPAENIISEQYQVR